MEHDQVTVESIAVIWTTMDNMRGCSRYGCAFIPVNEQMEKARRMFDRLRKDRSIRDVKITVATAGGDEDVVDEFVSTYA